MHAPTTVAAGLMVLMTLGQTVADAQTPPLQPPTLVIDHALAWRALGPARAGPITAVTGDPAQFGTFYAGAAGGGLWTTSDFGAHWRLLFEAPPVGHVTAVATADRVLYAAVAATATTGAVYRSDDAGTTWARVEGEGLGSRRVSHLLVDPANPQRLLAASLASRAGAAGLFQSQDGGRTFARLLAMPDRDHGPGIFAVPAPHDVTLAVGTVPDRPSTTPALLRSIDNGLTWQATTGLPAIGPGTWLDIATTHDGTLVALVVEADGSSLRASSDAGATWHRVEGTLPPGVQASARPRLTITAEETWLVAAGDLYESHDSGHVFTPADDLPGVQPSLVWAHPSLAGVRIVAGARGVVVSVNGGASWSSAETLPAAVIDRVSVDAAFPFRVCATSDDAVACATAQEDVQGRAWHPLPDGLAGGAIVSSPTDPDIVMGGAGIRHDRRTGQTIDIRPGDGSQTTDGGPVPMIFSADGRTLFAGSDAVWLSTNGGQDWTATGPALAAAPARIVALAASTVDPRALWAGLDDGRVFVTRSGGQTWIEASRPQPGGHARVRAIEPSRFDPDSAYVVLAGDDGDDTRRLWRTRDRGTSWTAIGPHPETAVVHAVREDPLRRGLLFAGTDASVFVSFDDGETWQPIGLNLPATPVTDLAVKDADLVAATAGRGVWVLDDLSPLRQVTPDVLRADLFLFRPAPAWRVRATPAGAPGAFLTYALGRQAGEVTLEVIETRTGDVIRRFSSAPGTGLAADPTPLPAAPGLHRVRWDLRYPPPMPDAAGAAPGTTVLPGTYQVRLTVDGHAVRQAVTIRMDPRITTATIDLTAQRDLGRAVDAARAAVHAARTAASPDADTGTASAAGPAALASLAALADDLERLAHVLQQADVRPSARTAAALGAGSR